MPPKKTTGAKKAPAKKTVATKSAAAKKAAKTRAENRAAEIARQQAEKDKWSTWDKRIRDGVMFLFGLGVAYNELVLESKPREVGLLFAASILGIPFVLLADERRREGKKP